MKKIGIVIFICATLFVSIYLIEFSLCKLTYNKNQKEAEKILELAYDIVSQEKTSKDSDMILSNTENSVNNNATISENDIIGILKIPKLKIEAPVKEGTSQEIMKTSIGHFVESDYWTGNVSFASHNSGTSVHYFERINTLKTNDEIEYITKFGSKKYKVKEIKKIESTDWSMVVKNDLSDTQNTITLITCINGKPLERLCVRGVEI